MLSYPLSPQFHLPQEFPVSSFEATLTSLPLLDNDPVNQSVFPDKILLPSLCGFRFRSVHRQRIHFSRKYFLCHQIINESDLVNTLFFHIPEQKLVMYGKILLLQITMERLAVHNFSLLLPHEDL